MLPTRTYTFHHFQPPAPIYPVSPAKTGIKRRISNEQAAKGPSSSEIAALFKKMSREVIDDSQEKILKASLGVFFKDKIVPTPIESPFYSTDLVIFSDDFKGLLPLNVVTVSHYLRILAAYEKIASGKTNIQIEGGLHFRDEVLKCIKTLLTARIGRKLLCQICSYTRKRLFISPITPRHAVTQTVPITNDKARFYFDLTSGYQKNVRDPKTGRKLSQPIYSHVEFAHELIHVWRLFSAENKDAFTDLVCLPPTLNRQFHNLEEQETITSGQILAANFPTTLEMAEMIPWPEEENHAGQNSAAGEEQITENMISSILGPSRTLPRIDHSGCNTRPEKIDVKDPATIEYFLDACLEGIYDTVKELLDKGMDPNATDPEDPRKITGLMLAAKNGELEVMHLLLERGADPNLMTIDGLHMLHFAIESDDPKFFEIVSKMRNVYLLDVDNAPVPLLHHVFRSPFLDPINMFRKLLGIGASVWKLSMPDGDNVLHAAASVFDLQLFIDLTKMNLDPHQINKLGLKPIHRACEFGNKELVEYLFSRGENLYQTTPNGKTLMHFAAASGNILLVDYLLFLEHFYHQNYGFETSFKQKIDQSGNTPMSYALQNQSNPNYISDLMLRGFEVPPQNYPEYVAIFSDRDTANCEIYLDLVYNQPGLIDKPFCRGMPLLHYAISEGDLPLTFYALKKGANPNLPAMPQLEQSALHDAVELDRSDLVLLLIDGGARLDIKDIEGQPPMFIVQDKLKNNERVDPLIIQLLQGRHTNTPVRALLNAVDDTSSLG